MHLIVCVKKIKKQKTTKRSARIKYKIELDGLVKQGFIKISKNFVFAAVVFKESQRRFFSCP